MTVRVVDIETTGIDPSQDAIVEIASVDVLADGTITNRRSTLVRPPIRVPPEASAVHHLIAEDLAGAPLLEEVLGQFKGADAYVAHNADFERAFLEPPLGEAHWVCTYKSALRIWPDLPSHSNQALRYRFGFVNPFGIDRQTLSPHRALSDAIVTASVFTEVIKHAKWSELMQWSSEPALLSVIRFGQHYGERFDAVPIDYLQWIVEGRNELREEIKHSARYWLGKRASNGVPTAGGGIVEPMHEAGRAVASSNQE
jgi:exodeoxyribonuclease X